MVRAKAGPMMKLCQFRFKVSGSEYGRVASPPRIARYYVRNFGCMGSILWILQARNPNGPTGILYREAEGQWMPIINLPTYIVTVSIELI